MEECETDEEDEEDVKGVEVRCLSKIMGRASIVQ